MGLRVYVIVISHAFGNNVYASDTEYGAYEHVYGFVKDYWAEVSSKKIPRNKDLAIKKYFEKMAASESYTIDEVTVK